MKGAMRMTSERVCGAWHRGKSEVVVACRGTSRPSQFAFTHGANSPHFIEPLGHWIHSLPWCSYVTSYYGLSATLYVARWIWFFVS